jgi:HEXXH motif-containing protein
MPSEMMGADLLPQYLGASFKDAGSVGPFAECLKKSADLLQAHAPDYLDWVAEVIKFIAPVSAPADLIGSSSSPRFFGMISISDNSRPLSVAEFLVHEASHQYFIIAASLGEMDEGSEGQLFYSRFARRDRPLERILAAFHALANMALFYERCLADGVPCEGRLAYMATHMRELDEILRNAETLSPLGKSLWLPLSQKTRHLDMKADETISNAVLAESDRVMASLRRQPA